MEFLSKLERIVLGWLKSLPHLPLDGRKWLGDNVWWVIAIAAALSGIGALSALIALVGNISALSSPIISYYASPTFITWVIIKTIVAFVFIGMQCALFTAAITPLKAKQKKGWVLLFTALLVAAISLFINANLTLDAFGFITSLIFGALWLGIWAYFLFEIHGEFAHVERSSGVKSKKKIS